ncbi:MAG: ORF6N domain-containing protein [Desulfobacteraceae bacterium]|nr:MAG: ORF6N domain-containing protein [Desulfobacteraceae bacterium]
MKAIVPVEVIERRICLIRGQKVILDSDLAELYGVTTKRLNEQVKRNKSRFPEDFMFQLSAEEKAEVVANCDHLSKLKFSPVPPFAFTEHGAIMAAGVLNSQRAVAASIYVVRVFVRLREILSAHKELARKLNELEGKITHHDAAIRTLVDAIKQLMKQPEPKKKKIGFILREQRPKYKAARKTRVRFENHRKAKSKVI